VTNPSGRPKFPPPRAGPVPAQSLPLRDASGEVIGMAFADRPAPAEPAELPPPVPANYFQITRRALRGRYLLSILLGLICASASAAAAWLLVHPAYESHGLLHISNGMPVVLQETDFNRPLPTQMFDTYMQNQKVIITSPRVIESAIQQPVWNATQHLPPASPVQYFAKYMKLDVKPHSEFIQISVTDPDPVAAADAVNSIITAYTDLFHDEEDQVKKARTNTLAQEADGIDKQIGELELKLTTGATAFGGMNPDVLCAAAEARAAKQQELLDDVRSRIAAADHPAGTAPVASTQPAKLTLTPEEISVTDGTMLGLMHDQTTIEGEIELLRRKIGPEHPQMKEALDRLTLARHRTEEYAVQYNRRLESGLSVTGENGHSMPIGEQSVEALRATEAVLVRLETEARTAMTSLATQRQELLNTQDSLTQLRAEAKVRRDRLNLITTEQKAGGGSRLTSKGDGEVPIAPEQDRRPVVAAGAGATGFLIPAAIIVGLSLLRPRYRYAGDVSADLTAGGPLLGILPELKNQRTRDARARSASHGIHQLRLSLRASGVKAGPCTYLVTSATAGEGKTSVAMALGLSFAASRLTTLLIDASLSGTGFSGASSLTTATGVADREGLCEAVAQGRLGQRVFQTDAGVHVLTCGRSGPHDSCALSGRELRAVLREARDYFDVILIDSGPILGSLEVSVVAPEVDGVIFLIGRGQDRNRTLTAIHRLQHLGGKIVGFVFNRARRSDLAGTPYEAPKFDAGPMTRYRQQLPHLAKFGLLVRAVASGLPATPVAPNPMDEMADDAPHRAGNDAVGGAA
jgi:succinoglycan biosynthesis transport protein ExoP